MKRICCVLMLIALLVVVSACGGGANPSSSGITSDALSHSSFETSVQPVPTSTPLLSFPSQITTPTPRPTPVPHVPPMSTGTPSPSSSCIIFSNDATLTPPKNGGLDAPYGPAPVSAEAQQLTSELFALVNSDRAACGLPPFAWNSTLASGALLHSWNMYNCGFSHTCPDGMSQCQRIANEGFAGDSDCGENIGLAGPYPTPWGGVYAVQESMAHEPLGGWHRIHLFSTTLHQMGIGIYVAPNGWLWFTEDMAG